MWTASRSEAAPKLASRPEEVHSSLVRALRLSYYVTTMTTVQPTVSAPRLTGRVAGSGNGPEPPGGNAAAASALPARLGAWSLQQIPSGVWLSTRSEEVPAEVLALAADPGWLTAVVEAEGPDDSTDQLLGLLFAEACSAGLMKIRLVLPAAADRYGLAAAAAYGLDIIAAEAGAAITPHGYALVRSGRSAKPGAFPQWRLYLPGGYHSPAGVLSPSPVWERALTICPPADLGPHMAVCRVPAGLALHPAGSRAEFAREAMQVWPDPERVTIVIDGTGPDESLSDAVTRLLLQLPGVAVGGVRLWWPRAGAAGAARALREVARRCDAEIIAPTADVSVVDGSCGVCHGPMGAAPWLRFTPYMPPQRLGSLSPAPAWERALADVDLSGAGDGLVIERVPAGLFVCRQGQSGPGLAATARSIIPDPERATIIASASAGSEVVGRDLHAVAGLLPAGARRSLRIVAFGAGPEGAGSFAQSLADAVGSHIVAPVRKCTATPDGRLLARPPAGPGPEPKPTGGSWREFFPGREPTGTPGPPDSEPGGEVEAGRGADIRPAAPPSRGVVLLPTDHWSSPEDRRRYRDSAPRYQEHAAAVRHMLAQRPGLRAAAAGNRDAVVTDFAAVLDFLRDRYRGVPSVLSSVGPADNPRAACVVSALRRLPSFTGAVFSSASSPGLAASGYVTGMDLIEPGFVIATSSHLAAPRWGIDYVIWSETGRHVAALAADAGRDEVLFAAGSTFRVLRIDDGGPGPRKIRVFLREVAKPRRTRSGGARAATADGSDRPRLDEMGGRVLERLVMAAALRDDACSDRKVLMTLVGDSGRPIGLDEDGVPYADATTR
jgi:hypothetical protein